MSTAPCEILEVAKALMLSPSEASSRSAISRAYYSAFHCAIAVLPENHGADLKSGSSHEEVISAMLVYSKKLVPARTEAAQIAEALPRLKKKRKIADYQLDSDLTCKDAELAIAQAERIIKLGKAMIEKLSQAAEVAG